MRKTLLSTAAAIGMGLFASQASAVIIPTDLALLLDASASISDANYQLQVDAYAAQVGALIPIDGTVAVYVAQFGLNVEELFPLTLIDSQMALDDLVDVFANATRANIDTSATAIGDAIDLAAAALLADNFDRDVIDVSTDGANNTGEDPDTAADNFIAAGGDQVNCLGIGAGSNCGFIAGTGSFFTTVTGFADFEAALETKISREVGIPEPATLALIGSAVVAAGFAARRRKA